MADQNIKTVIKTEVDTSQVQTGLVNLRKEYADGFKDLQQLQKGTAAYYEQLQKVANIKEEITDLRQAIKALSPDERFKAIADSAKGLLGGFEALTGAVTLFSGKNKEMEETLKSVQSALLIFEGLQNFIEGLKRTGNLIGILTVSLQRNAVVAKEAAIANEATAVGMASEAEAAEVATVATSGFNKVLAASAIGAILLLLPLFASGMGDIADNTKDAADSTDALNKAHEKTADSLTKEASEVLVLVNRYKDENVSKGEKLKIQKQLNDDYPNYFGNLGTEHINVDQLTKDYDKWSQAILLKAQADADAAVIQEKLQENIKLKQNPEESIGFIKKATLAISNFFGNVGISSKILESANDNSKEAIAQNKADIDALLKDSEDTFLKLQALGGDPTKQNGGKTTKEKATKDENDKVLELFREFYAKLKGDGLKSQEDTLKDLADFHQKAATANEDARGKELAELDQHYQTLKDRAMLNGDDTTQLTEDYGKQKAGIIKKFDDAEEKERLRVFGGQYVKANKAAEDAILANKTQAYGERKALLDQEQKDIEENFKNKKITEEQYNNAVENNHAARLNLDQQEVQSKRDAVAAISGALGSLADLVDKNSVAGKAIAVGQAIINTYQGATLALASAPPPYSFIEMAAVIAAGLINVTKIINTKVSKSDNGAGSYGSVSAAATPSYTPAKIPTSSTVTDLSEQSINAINQTNQTTVRAYVVERDITTSQARIQAYRQEATIGH